MTQTEAEAIALRALGWMAGQPEVMGGFLGASGLGPADLRTALATAEGLSSVLDHLLDDDTRARDCTIALALPADGLLRARAALPGGALPHWT